MVQSIGTVVAPNQATYSKSRGNMTKVKIKIDLIKARQDKIWMGYKRPYGNDNSEWLTVEYKGAPSYCQYC